MPSFQLIFFVIGVVCSLPFLYWYYRRNPHPRFRPRIGEMLMVSLFAVLLSLGGSMLIGGLMDDPEQFKPNDGFSAMPSDPAGSGPDQSNDQGEDTKKSSGGRDRSGSAGDSRGEERR
jgi:hypothetical protein